MAGVQKLPRDASPTRLRNRDVADGRPRGHLARFGLSRVRFRQMAHAGELPGIRKSGWWHRIPVAIKNAHEVALLPYHSGGR